MSARDKQIGGDHYRSKRIQPWDAMECWMSLEEFCGYLRGNIIKYMARYPEKGGVEDLRKARHYLDKLIETLELSPSNAPMAPSLDDQPPEWPDLSDFILD